MSITKGNPVIQSGIVLENKQISAHTFHLKIQSNYFAAMHYVPGFTVDIFLENPINNPQSENRKYSFWNYEPVYQVADFAICTFSNGKGAKWIQTLQAGDTIYFKPPKGKLLLDDSANNYLLIGDITSLSHLYEINRNLPVSKSTFSFIYAEQQADIFPDIDHSFPLNFHIIKPTSSDLILNKIINTLPIHFDNTIAYIVGHPEICMAIHNYLKNEGNFVVQNLRTKPFWKTGREKTTNG